MAESSASQRLEQRLGYRFKDTGLIQLALTHSSHSRRNNERLEFLGDSHLNYVIARELYQRFAYANEGELSRLRAHLVNGAMLASMAREFGIGADLRLGAGERKSGGADRDSILADTMEALIGAILIDAGPEPCGEIVITWYAERLADLDPARPHKDAKTRLQEFLQGRGRPLPVYQIESVRGQAHEQEFEVSCAVSGLEMPCIGQGKSRRAAEQVAAELTLRQLGVPTRE